MKRGVASRFGSRRHRGRFSYGRGCPTLGKSDFSLSDADAARIEAEACRPPKDVGIPVTHGSASLLGAHVLHLTPKHASWLNQVECAFSILQAEVLARGSFRTLDELQDAVSAFLLFD